MCFCEIYEIFKNTFFTEHLRWLLLCSIFIVDSLQFYSLNFWAVLCGALKCAELQNLLLFYKVAWEKILLFLKKFLIFTFSFSFS